MKRLILISLFISSTTYSQNESSNKLIKYKSINGDDYLCASAWKSIVKSSFPKPNNANIQNEFKRLHFRFNSNELVINSIKD